MRMANGLVPTHFASTDLRVLTALPTLSEACELQAMPWTFAMLLGTQTAV
jgi:hypothetical protein